MLFSMPSCFGMSPGGVGLVRLACDNTAVIDAINKHSIKGETVRPLQSILLIAALFDISLFSFWIPSEENMVTDAASRHDYSKLANLGLQISHREPSIKTSTLRQKLNIFFTTPSHQQPVALTTLQENPMNPSVGTTTTSHSPCPSKRSHCLADITSTAKPATAKSYLTALRSFHLEFGSFNHSHLMTLALTSSLGAESESMAKASKDYDSHSQLQSSFDCSMKSDSMKKVLISNRHSVWHLPTSYDLENLHGIHGPNNIIHPISHGNTSSLLQTQ